MEQAELEKVIKQARLDRITKLELNGKSIESLPESIFSLSELTSLQLNGNKLTTLPEHIGNLLNLTSLGLCGNNLTVLPKNIGNLSNLVSLSLNGNKLTTLPESIGDLSNLTSLRLSENQLTNLPKSIGNLSNLISLSLSGNKLTTFPESIAYLSKLVSVRLNFTLTDLSLLQKLPSLETVMFLDINIPCRYWIKLSDWKSEWLMDEDNAEIRRVLIEQLGYEKICKELNAINLDTWREYTLLKIDGIGAVYNEDDESIDSPEATLREREPMVLLKMTCPSTQHIHILRVPPEMVSAEAAITWVNHGIHPDEFAVQT
jgi:leucine-rich repeat protein SHOC2